MGRSDQIFTEYMNDVERYLKSRFANIPGHEFQEMSVYLANRAIVLVNDVQLASWRVSKDELARRHKAMTELRKELLNNGNSQEV